MRLLPFLLVVALPLAAQDPLAFQEIPDAAANQWVMTLGARLMSYSASPGSDTQRTVLMPAFSAQYNRFYLGSSRVGVGFGGGVQIWRANGFSWDLGLGIGDGRPESRAPELAGMGDRRATLWAGTGLGWRQGLWHARATLAHGLADQAGTRATVTGGRIIPLDSQWFLSTGLHASVADGKNMAYDFGISPDQAQRRAALVAAGDSRLNLGEVGPFVPAGGLRDIGASLSLGYRPQPRLTVGISLFGGQLQGDARISPLVQRTAYLSGGIGFAYRLRSRPAASTD